MAFRRIFKGLRQIFPGAGTSITAAQGVAIGDHNLVVNNRFDRAEVPNALTDGEYERLVTILDGVPAIADVDLILDAAARDIGWSVAPGVDAVDCVGRLRASTDAYLLFAFVERLAAACGEPPARRLLQRWVDDTAPRWVLAGGVARLRGLRGEVAASPAPVARERVIVELRRDTVDRDGFWPTVWSARSDAPVQRVVRIERPVRLGEARVEVERVLARHCAAGPVRKRNPIIVFAVPPDLLDVPFEQWLDRRAGGPIGLRHPVVVAILPADDSPGPDRPAGPTRVCWLDDESDVQPAEALCLAMIGERVGRRLERLSAERPTVAVWHRGPRADRRRALNRVLNNRSSLAELPDIVHAQRMQAAEPDASADHPGREIVLLWSDADTTPPAWQTLVAPRQRRAPTE